MEKSPTSNEFRSSAISTFSTLMELINGNFVPSESWRIRMSWICELFWSRFQEKLNFENYSENPIIMGLLLKIKKNPHLSTCPLSFASWCHSAPFEVACGTIWGIFFFFFNFNIYNKVCHSSSPFLWWPQIAKSVVGFESSFLVFYLLNSRLSICSWKIIMNSSESDLKISYLGKFIPFSPNQDFENEKIAQFFKNIYIFFNLFHQNIAFWMKNKKFNLKKLFKLISETPSFKFSRGILF